MKARKVYFMETRLAGGQYYDLADVWDKLKIGTHLLLERDENNPYDHDAVSVYYTDPESDERYALGFLPRGDNESIATFLNAGWASLFDCVISSLDAEAHYEHRVKLAIRINRKPGAKVTDTYPADDDSLVSEDKL